MEYDLPQYLQIAYGILLGNREIVSYGAQREWQIFRDFYKPEPVIVMLARQAVHGVYNKFEAHGRTHYSFGGWEEKYPEERINFDKVKLILPAEKDYRFRRGTNHVGTTSFYPFELTCWLEIL